MMTIACLGWGSLIWKPGDLPIQGEWSSDGPLLPIEFARQSSGDRITLVITPGVPRVRSLWAVMAIEDVTSARIALADREGVIEKNRGLHISVWEGGISDDPVVTSVSGWARDKGIDKVIWTNLPPKFKGKERIPTTDEVIEHLRNLDGNRRMKAENYIRRAPRQIDTEYRRRIEAEFGWTPL